MKTCKRCGKEKNEKDFNKWYKKSGSNGYRSYCRECDHIINKEFRLKNKDELKYKRRERIGPYKKKLTQKEIKERNAAYAKKHSKENPIKSAARSYLRYMVKWGKLMKPDTCEVCLKNGLVEGHHEDYSKPLEVKWVCKRCHTDIHRKKV